MGIDKVFIIVNWYFTALSNTKYSIEKTSFLWCNANVLRLNAPLILVIKIKGMVSLQLVWRVSFNYAIYY